MQVYSRITWGGSLIIGEGYATILVGLLCCGACRRSLCSSLCSNCVAKPCCHGVLAWKLCVPGLCLALHVLNIGHSVCFIQDLHEILVQEVNLGVDTLILSLPEGQQRGSLPDRLPSSWKVMESLAKQGASFPAQMLHVVPNCSLCEVLLLPRM